MSLFEYMYVVCVCAYLHSPFHTQALAAWPWRKPWELEPAETAKQSRNQTSSTGNAPGNTLDDVTPPKK